MDRLPADAKFRKHDTRLRRFRMLDAPLVGVDVDRRAELIGAQESASTAAGPASRGA